jgi:hypothetical protein
MLFDTYINGMANLMHNESRFMGIQDWSLANPVLKRSAVIAGVVVTNGIIGLDIMVQTLTLA